MRLLVLLLVSSWWGFGGEPLRVSYTPMPVSTPLLLADAMGSFQKAGLDVQLKEYSLGKLALEDMSKGTLDVAAAAVTPLVYKHFNGDDFRIFTTMASSTGMIALAARKDFGILKIADIAGKRVGVPAGTSGEYFFETMRVLNRIPKDSVRVVDGSMDFLVNGLREGSLDVVSTWEPDIQRLRHDLTNRLTLFYGAGVYTFTWSLAALPGTIQARRADLEKLTRVLSEMAEIIEVNPGKAREELTRRMGERGKELSAHLEEARFRPHLGQELLVQMEGEARWILARDGKTNRPPNFLGSLDTSILKKVKPSAVSLIE
jgi:NitT/TauT family transport system substrate-binding protein